MKKILRPFILAAAGILFIYASSCKGHSSEVKTDTTVVTPAVPNNAQDTAIVISPDETLKNNLIDATKDFPGVTATVDQGVVTLTGDITRDKLPKLMMAVNGLHPKKVNNNLTIK
jgi:hypothetical protein